MLCTIAELCNLETGLILRIRFYPRILLQLMQEQQQFWEQRKGTRLETLSVVASPSWLILAQQLQCSVQAISIGCCRKTTCKQGASCLLEVFSSTAASCVLTAQHARVQCCRLLFLCGKNSIRLGWPFGLAPDVLCWLGLAGVEW